MIDTTLIEISGLTQDWALQFQEALGGDIEQAGAGWTWRLTPQLAGAALAELQAAVLGLAARGAVCWLHPADDVPHVAVELEGWWTDRGDIVPVDVACARAQGPAEDWRRRPVEHVNVQAVRA